MYAKQVLDTADNLTGDVDAPVLVLTFHPASPKIHQDSQSVNDVHPDENVRKHNEEAAKRHDRSTNDKDEKVHKGYWSTERASE